MDIHLTMAEHQMQKMMGAIMNKFQKQEAQHEQTVAMKSRLNLWMTALPGAG